MLFRSVGMIDSPSSGEYWFNDEEVGSRSENELVDVRKRNIGFIFQNFHLIPTLTALENVVLAAELNDTPGAAKKANDLLGTVGLSDRLHHYPVQLSGGEQQRLSLARAFVNEPDIILADEPTGNLDSKNSDHIIKLMLELHRVKQATIILVTHELHVAEGSQRILTLADGQIISDRLNP